MVIYRHHGKKRETVASTPGTFEKQNYYIEIDKETRHKIIKPSGMTNTWEMVQTAKDESDINLIIKRATKTGAIEGLDPAKAIFGDFTGIPDSMIEIANLKLKADEAWNKLPIEVREKYNHDKDAYFADIGSEDWMKLHGFTGEKPVEPIKEEEVKE